MKLTKKIVLNFLKEHQLMAVATTAEHPWIATVYYSFDQNLNLFFLSDPTTLHCKHIAQNNKVAVAIADSSQKVSEAKKGLQLWGTAEKISDAKKIQHALTLWKDALNVKDTKLSYENMLKKVVSGRMYKITPKQIKLFDQELFDVDDGKEPILEL